MAHYDLLVIGSGPGGQKAAIQAAKIGKRVGLIERKEVVGGVCINTGTIPSKTLREAVMYFTGVHERTHYGENYRVKQHITIEDLSFRCRRVIEHQQHVIQHQLNRNQVDLICGKATFRDPHRVAVERLGETLEHTANYIVIAVGTEPTRPTEIPFDDETIIDSDGLLNLKTLPKSLTIVGAGVIGCEYASILATMGIPVVLIDKRPGLLDFVDTEITEALHYHMRNHGVTLCLGEEVVKIERTSTTQVPVLLKSRKQVSSSTLMYAAGRQGATADLNLESLGLQTDARGRIAVNHNYQTSVPHVYAVGDVIGFPSLASTSLQQGRHAACHAFGMQCQTVSELLPYGIYTIPEISMVGYSEETLSTQAIPYEVGIAQYREIARGQIIGDTTGMLKLLFHTETKELLGIHAIGHGATELIHIGQAVMAHHGKITYFVDTVFNYPTLAECYKVAALAGLNRLCDAWAPLAESVSVACSS